MYACWYPVGSPEYRERRDHLDAESITVGAGVAAELAS